MKRVLLLGVGLLLAGCSEDDKIMLSNVNVGWMKTGTSLQDAKAFEAAGISPEDAVLWKKCGVNSPSDVQSWRALSFSPDQAKNFIAIGLDTPAKASAYASAVSYDQEMMSDAFAGQVYSGVVDGYYTLPELSQAYAGAGQYRNDPIHVIEIAKKLHAGKSSSAAVADIQSQQMADLHRKVVAKFGEDVSKICGDIITLFPQPIMGLDPYAMVGKCYALSVSSYNFRLQWLDETSLLMLDWPAMVTADEHIKLNTPFIAVGIKPEQYQSALGAVQTPVTIRILKYTDRGTILQ